MAKTNKEDINDIRSLIEDVDAAQNKITQQQAILEQQLNKLNALLEAIKKDGITQINSVNIEAETIANAVRSALNNTENNRHDVLTLSAEHQKLIVETAIKGLSQYLKEGEKIGEQKHKQKVDEYKAARSKQGLSTVAEVKTWAPEYSFTVQRWLRWIGRQLFNKEEEAVSTHEALKTIGNALQLLEGQEPTLKMYLRPKWRRWLLLSDDRCNNLSRPLSVKSNGHRTQECNHQAPLTQRQNVSERVSAYRLSVTSL